MPLLSIRAVAVALSIATLAGVHVSTQTDPRLGGNYSSLDTRRQRLVNDWVSRFNTVTGQRAQPAAFYDSHVTLSARTTFDAVTNALMTTQLTDESGGKLGDALSLVSQLESVRGQVAGASGDRQFRLYVRLTDRAVEILERSREFKRGADNTVYHEGYPINYRQQGGPPSIQVSVAREGGRADIDVDYRAASFPAAVFNGHLTSANSDVRAGDNYDRHTGRWSGFQNWWRSFFGIRQGGSAGEDSGEALFPPPRIGDKNVDAMMHDFLTAWLIDKNIRAAMGYVADRAYTCLALDTEDPFRLDRGTAPFVLMRNLKAATDALEPQTSLQGLSLGTRLTNRELRLIQQPHHAQFVMYSVPDDIAAVFDCESRLTPGAVVGRRVYGTYFGTTFAVRTGDDQARGITLLWARSEGFWRIVSWRIESEPDDTPGPEPIRAERVQRERVDATFAAATRLFLDAWLVRKDYDTAFAYLAPASYTCFNLFRDPGAPAATSPEEAGKHLRTGLAAIGKQVGQVRDLGQVVAPQHPRHVAARELAHADEKIVALSSVSDALAAAMDCTSRAEGRQPKPGTGLEFGNAYGSSLRFRTRAGEAPVLHMLWRRDGANWRIVAYDIEVP
jgi:hypothetical protein